MKEHRANLDAKLAKFGRKPRDCGILWSVRVQVAESESEAREKERTYLNSIPPEAGLIELLSMYGLDFSLVRREMRLVDVADEVKAQNAHWGSFEISEDDRSEFDGGRIRPEVHDGTHPCRSRHTQGHRRSSGGIAFRNGRQRRIYACARIFGTGATCRSSSTLSFQSFSAGDCAKRGMPARRCARIY